MARIARLPPGGRAAAQPLLPLLMLVVALLAAATTTVGGATKVTWNYRYNGDDWGGKCNTGTQQSPINMAYIFRGVGKRVFKPVYLGCARYTVVNVGPTVEIRPGPGCPSNTLYLSSGTYDLVEAHGHTVSEHTVGGTHYPLEMQFVHRHRTKPGKLAIISVFMKYGRVGSQFVDWWLLPAKEMKAGENRTITRPLNFMSGLLSDWRGTHALQYWSYSGSLTNPPCTENVEWYVLKPSGNSPIVSVDQINSFMDVLQNSGFQRTNNRPLRSTNRRVVRQYSAVVKSHEYK